MRRFSLTAIAVALALSCIDQASADDRSHGRRDARPGHEEQYRDGNCRVKRKWEKDGDFKEELECKGTRREPTVLHARSEEPILVSRGSGLACNRALLGSAIGGAAGGLLGNQIGRGDGRTAATIGGAILGVLVGGSIGRSMDEVGQACVGHTLERADVDRVVSWENADGRAYEVKPTRSFEDATGRLCREYTTARIDGRLERAYGTACRQPDGSWKLAG